MRRGAQARRVADTADARAVGQDARVVGLGRLGKHVAGLGRAYGMRVLAWSRTLTEAAALEVGAER